MFRPKEDRLNYGQLLLPPVGYELDLAVGTTYSLDLETLMTACIALGIQESTDSSLCNNPFAVLKSLQNLSEKLLIFCEAGQIAGLNPERSPLMLLMDKMIVPVKLKGIKGRGYPSFHAKTWLLQYSNNEGDTLFRFIVLSRNLTFDRSWDVAVSLDGHLTNRRQRSSDSINDFIRFLKETALDGVSGQEKEIKNKKRKILDSFIDDLPYVKFDLENDKRFTDFEVLPLGVGKNEADLDYDSLTWESFHELLIISPFVSSEIIQSFDDRKPLKGTRKHLFTRTAELHKLAGKIKTFNVFTMKDAVVEGESIVSDDESEKVQQQDIHAKLYLMTIGSESYLYLGSMNASENGLHRNVEMLLKLTSRHHYLNMDLIEGELFGQKDKDNPFEEVVWDDLNLEEPKKEEKDVLEKVIKEICRLKSSAIVKRNNGNKYDVYIKFDCPKEGIQNVDIAPARTIRTQPLAPSVVFKDLSPLELTELYRITVTGKKESITRMILIPTAKIPESRDDMVIKSIIKDKKAFVDYLSFILGDDYVLNLIDTSALGAANDTSSRGEDALPAIYEKMLKAAYSDPERLKDIQLIMNRISDSDIIPEEFVNMYNTFAKTLNLK